MSGSPSNTTEKLKINLDIARNVFNHVFDAAWYIDLEYANHGRSNKKFYKMLGYDPTDDVSLDLLSCKKTMVPEDFDDFISNILKLADTPNDKVERELQFFHKDGSEVWTDSKAMVIKDEFENPRYIIVAHTNITPRKIQELDAKLSRNQFEKANSAVSIGSWEIDLTSKNLDLIWSQNINEIFEMPIGTQPSLEEAISMLGKESQAKIEKIVENSVKGEDGHFDLDIPITTFKGNSKWIRAVGIPITQNGINSKLCGIAMDITTQKETRLKLSITEDQFQKTFNFGAVGMALVKLNGSWLKVNQQAYSMLGYTQRELLAATYQDIIHPEDFKKDLQIIEDLIKGERSNHTTQNRFYHKKGHIIWALLSVSIVRDDHGRPLHFLAQMINIDELKTSKIEISKLLETTRKQNKRLLNFADIVSHNVRSHTGNLSLLLNLMKLDEPEATKNSIFPMLQKTVSYLEETIGTLNEITNFHIENSESLKTVKLANAIENIVDLYKPEIIGLNGEIKVHVDEALQPRVIPEYLDGILKNLIENAIKFRSANRRLKISIKTEKVPVGIKISIKDNGLGFDSETNRYKLFKMYKTFHNRTDSKGIGLFISKNQVEAMGGAIDVSSKIDSGSIFSITLPYDED